MKIDKVQLKKDGINTASTIGGMVLGNAASKLIPIENGLIKSAIPTVAGGGLVVLGNAMKQNWMKGLGTGLATFGVLALINNAVNGQNMPGTSDLPEGTSGIAGIGDNPAVSKIVDILIPNLGSTESNSDVEEYDFNNDGVEDINYEDLSYDHEEPLGLVEDIDAQPFLEGIEDDGAVFLQGIEDDGAVFLQGFGYDDHQNDPYEQDFNPFN